ncbi:MAG: DEAD/DEAH box helicase family protein [Thermodesulfobacteriota bacterium]
MAVKLKTSEMRMEEQTEDWLVRKNAYISRNNTDYDKKLSLDTELVLAFIYATQPDEWGKLKKQHGSQVQEKFLKRLADEIGKRGTLDVLRKGVRDYGCYFDLFYPLPASTLNVAYQKLFQANMFRVMRQVYFSERNNKSVDMVLFINGLPIITIELKDQLSGQSVEHAIKQFKYDRDSREPYFAFKRNLVYFAVDEDLVYMTTKLENGKTKFLPFNKGRDGGAGNPDTAGFKTEYLWKEILTKEILSEIIKDFLHIEDVLDEKGKPTGEQKLIFPRYHQLDAVRQLVEAAKKDNLGKSYLIQHSAGSGKSNTIAWLCHNLTSLHDKKDKVIFDSIIVVTDRLVLDRQLQRTVHQFAQVSGVVEKIDKGSKKLKEALESGKKIIVTTIQKFPYIVDDITKLPGKKFAIVVDEAHSSQSGETSKSLKMVLSVSGLEEAEEKDIEEVTWEDEITKEIDARGRLKNVSYFAFTATPKGKTFELFGEKQEDGSYLPFHLYTMRQAIEEAFIRDVLKNYTTYKTYFNLLKKIEDDPNYDKRKATALLRSFVDLHEHSINKKVEIMIEHFNDHVKNKIPDKNGNGQAKAMIVTRSRLHAVRFKLACDKYIKKKGYKFKTLVAFSGTVHDPDSGLDFTEAGMNGFSEKQTADEFKRAGNKFLIVANKFQTGFDQPLLYAMYVDKKLANVAAVQTLSRVNRIYSNKEDPLILDFANEADEIEKAFEDYYGETILSEGTDPNKLYDFQHKLLDQYVFSHEDVDGFAKLFFDKKVKQDKLHPILNEVVSRFEELPTEKQEEFKKLLRNYIRLYAFLSQIIPFKDINLEKLYVFSKMLIRKLPRIDDRLPVEVMEQVDMDSYRIGHLGTGIEIRDRGGSIRPARYDAITLKSKEKEALSKIIESINDKYGTDFTESDKVIAQQLQSRIESNPSLKASAKVNSKEKIRLTFDHLFDEKLQEIIDEHFDFYKKVNDNKAIRAALVAKMFEMVYQELAKT